MSQAIDTETVAFVINGPGAAGMRQIVAAPVVLGRAPDAGLRLQHASVSRRHAELCRRPDGQWSVRDLGSRNGTYLNGAGPLREHELRDGDVLIVGEFTLQVCLTDTTRAGRGTVGHAPQLTDDEPGSVITSLSHVEPPRLSAELVALVLKFGRELAGISDATERLARLVALPVSQTLGGWWCHALAVLERSDAAGRPGDLALDLLCDPVKSPAGGGHEPRLSRSVLRAVLDTGGPVIANRLLRPSSFQASMTVAPDAESVAVIACPIDEVQGPPGARRARVLSVTLSTQVAGIEWLALVSLAVEQFRHSESAWAAREADRARAALEREMAWARDLQAHTLPRRRAQAAGEQPDPLDWALRFEPCMAVGGDYADVICRPDGQVLLVVADVSGKGLRAALVASRLHAIFHADESCRSLADLVNAANRHLCRSLPPGAFVTLVALLIDPQTGRGACVNAGHPRAIEVSADGSARPMEGGDNFPLGLTDESLVGQEVLLQPGTSLCLYTDGISEMHGPDGLLLGTDAVAELFARVCASRPPTDPADALASDVLAALVEFRRSAAPADDVTLLLVRT